METMKYPNVSGGTSMAVSGNGANHVDEVDSIFSSSCWQHSGNSGNLQPEFIEAHKLMLENASGGGGGPLGASDELLMGSPISQQGDDSELATKATMDALDNLLLNSQPMNTSLAELKPLPPFAGYTANLSINGIQGQHYQLLAQRIPEENNNTYGNYGDQNIVSSSTCNVSVDSAGDSNKGMYEGVTKLGYVNCANPDSVSSAKIFDECGGNASATDAVAHIKTEMSEYDISSIEDIAAIIGSAIADTTVPNNNNNPDPEENAGSRDSWMDLDAWIDGACVEQHKNLIITQEALSEFVIPTTNSDYIKPQQLQQQQPVQGSSTLQTLLTHGYMPLLQNRLQNGPPIKQETPSSTNYSNDIISTSSPPANVGSTTDNLLLTVSGRYIPSYSLHGINDDPRIRSPDLVGQSYPHPTTTTPAMPKKSRSRAHKKQQQQSANSTVFQSDQSLGLLGKEKPVHRCNICNRGFLNKSNIKVHLRTHTGEKPFRCDTCAKAFRQKAHLLKHQQIHKRVGRD